VRVLVIALLRMTAPDGRPDGVDDDHITTVASHGRIVYGAVD